MRYARTKFKPRRGGFPALRTREPGMSNALIRYKGPPIPGVRNKQLLTKLWSSASKARSRSTRRLASGP